MDLLVLMVRLEVEVVEWVDLLELVVVVEQGMQIFLLEEAVVGPLMMVVQALQVRHLDLEVVDMVMEELEVMTTIALELLGHHQMVHTKVLLVLLDLPDLTMVVVVEPMEVEEVVVLTLLMLVAVLAVEKAVTELSL